MDYLKSVCLKWAVGFPASDLSIYFITCSCSIVLIILVFSNWLVCFPLAISLEFPSSLLVCLSDFYCGLSIYFSSLVCSGIYKSDF